MGGTLYRVKVFLRFPGDSSLEQDVYFDTRVVLKAFVNEVNNVSINLEVGTMS